MYNCCFDTTRSSAGTASTSSIDSSTSSSLSDTFCFGALSSSEAIFKTKESTTVSFSPIHPATKKCDDGGYLYSPSDSDDASDDDDENDGIDDPYKLYRSLAWTNSEDDEDLARTTKRSRLTGPPGRPFTILASEEDDENAVPSNDCSRRQLPTRPLGTNAASVLPQRQRSRLYIE